MSGRSNAEIYVASDTKVTFNDVAGVDEAIGELCEIVAFLGNPRSVRSAGRPHPRGRPAGRAARHRETLSARAVDWPSGRAVFSISGSEFVETCSIKRERRRRLSFS